MKLLKVFAALAVVAAVAGCSSIQTVEKKDLNTQKLTLDQKAVDITHINGDVWGLYFFMWPLLTGSTDNVGDLAILKDTVRLDKVVNMVTVKSKAIGAKSVVDMKSSRTGKGFIFYINDVQVSANAVK